MSLKIGVIVHGPTIIDKGYAKKIINLLSNYGLVSARLGGTMGRTAVIDASLENVINIEDKLLPSQSIELLSEDNDILFLLNYGKSMITGHTFGYKVLNNVGMDVDLIQIERPDTSDGAIICWSDNVDKTLLNNISKDLNMPIVSSNEVTSIVENLTGYNKEEGLIKRKIAGVSPGENIMLNGTIIGRVTSSNLEIIAQDNQIIKMIGGKIKKHGLEKLGKVDLTKAIVKTGLLRKTNNIKPRLMKHISSDKLTVVYLDHAAEDIYQYRNADLVVSVGDDTTLLSSDILYRFNVPIIGITDGDLDKVVLEGFKHDDSIIIQVESGYDDIIGEMIFKKVFSNKISRNVDDLVEFKKEILDTIDNSGISYKFVDKQLLD